MSLETLHFPTSVEPAVEVYRDPYTVIHRQVAHFPGLTKEYFCWDRGVRAAIIPMRDEHILLTRQYRFVANCISREIPGGAVEAGEEPAHAAVRECREETGVECLNPQPLIEFQPGLDTYRNPTFIFVADQLEGVTSLADERYVWLSLAEAERQVVAGEINDALSVIGILALARKCQQIKGLA